LREGDPSAVILPRDGFLFFDEVAMANLRALPRALLACAVLSMLPACAASTDDAAEEVGESTDALSAGIDCKTTQMTGYRDGKSFSLSVVRIGGKRVSLPTAHAFLKMKAAATRAGVPLAIRSGFRTQEEQKHFYGCYVSKRCNGGRLAAKPGFSNHQDGRALDLTTSRWLAKNASSFGFVRTVKRENWHYEFHGKDPGGPCSGANAEIAQTSDEDLDPTEDEADDED
jgi:hypothetical protein